MTTFLETTHTLGTKPFAVRTAGPKIAERDGKDRHLAHLMQRAQNGDRMSYSSLLKEVMRILQRVLQRRLGFLSASDREDMLQDIMLSLHAARATFDPARPFTPWLMAIAHNRMVDNARRNSRRFANEVTVDEYPATIADEDAAMPLEGYGDPEALRQAIHKLPPGQRTAVELLKLREMSLKEASAASGMSVTALKVSAHRAIKALRASLKLN
jgi:RNA polymerase sigma-70 factor (ECF subfamily)